MAIGKTLAFYRPTPHYRLEAIRTEILTAASKVLQRIVRGRLTYRVVKTLSKNIQKCESQIMADAEARNRKDLLDSANMVENYYHRLKRLTLRTGRRVSAASDQDEPPHHGVQVRGSAELIDVASSISKYMEVEAAQSALAEKRLMELDSNDDSSSSSFADQVKVLKQAQSVVAKVTSTLFFSGTYKGSQVLLSWQQNLFWSK